MRLEYLQPSKMADSTSLYMCSSCQQLFASLEDVLAHHLNCHLSSSAQNSRTSTSAQNFLVSSSSVLPRSTNNQTHRATSVPIIRYQCGECSALFFSLDQWQQHSKLGFCCVSGSEKDDGQGEVNPEATEKQNEEDEGTVKGSNHEIKDKEGSTGTKVEKDEGQLMKASPQGSVQANLQSEAMTKTETSNQQNLLGNQPDVDASASKFASDILNSMPTETFLCMHCGSGFASEEALAAHRSAHHGLQRMLHRCLICSQEFMSTTQYLYHRRQHREKGERLPVTVAQRINHVSGSPSKITGDVCQSQTPADMTNEQVVSIPESPQPASPLPSSSNPAFLLTSPLQQKHSGTHCPTCGQVFKRRCHMRVHMLRHSGQKPYSCEVCHKTFASKSNLGRHRQTHSSHQTYVCQQCGQSFSQMCAFKKHQLVHAQDQSIIDNGESENPDEKEEKKEKGEEKEESTRILFVCSDCPNKFRTHTQLLVHRFVHTGKYPFSCCICEESFPCKKSLQLHALCHQGKQPMTCPSCSDKFLNQTLLDAHLPLCNQKKAPGHVVESSVLGGAKKKNGGRVRLICDLCGHHCVTQEGLDLHKLSHSGQTPLRCPLLPCRRRFTSSSALQEHMLTHSSLMPKTDTIGVDSKPRPHHCQQCGKSFTTASSLNVHLRIHTGERPFQCSQCEKRFRQIPHLRDHERLHTGTRPFVCSVCDRAFLLAARLAEHARTHSGEKPYQCPVCHRAFRSLSNLGKHRKTHGIPISNEATTATVENDAEQQAGLAPVSPGHGQAAVHTILLVQAPETAQGIRENNTNSVDTATPSSPPLVFLQPVVGEGQQGVLTPVRHHTIEVVVAENNE